MAKTLVTGQAVLLDDGYLGPATITVNHGKIESVNKGHYLTDNEKSGCDEVIDAGGLVVMPGLIDSHVHVNEPGRTEWEGYWTATRAAAAGGFTTIVDMPLDSIPPTTTVTGFQCKQEHAFNQCFVDVAFWGGVVPGNESELRPMIDMGIVGFKCFLIHSGVDEFPHVTETDLHTALKQLQGTDSVLLFHAEMETSEAQPKTETDCNQSYSTFLDSRPDSMELEAIKLVVKMCKQYGVRCHIVHLSSAEALPIISQAKAEGTPLTVETCHHYLNLDAETVPQKATQYKCCPPIRSKSNQVKLWDAIRSGVIDMVVSDHSPCTADLKNIDKGDFMEAWAGISSVQFGLSLFWTSARQHGFTLHDMVRLMSWEAAKLANLHDRKGAIRPGHDADFIIWDPETTWEITKDQIQHKNKLTPYLGMKVAGMIHKTILRGDIIFDGHLSEKPSGQMLLKNNKHS